MTWNIRPAAVAGVFYPLDPDSLRQRVEQYLKAVELPKQSTPLRAVIVPHAGYDYSGPIAASAYRLIQSQQPRFTRVALFGPAHYLGFDGMALTRVSAFSTPLGEVHVDTAATEVLSDNPHVHYLDEAHAREHSLEVQLPFLQVVMGSPFQIIAVLVGDASAQHVAAAMETLWDDKTLIVISSDLSHYLDYQSARIRDEATSKAIETLRFEDIHYEDACGRNPLKGLLWLARRRNLTVNVLDLRNSADTAGSKDRVVGYGAYSLA